MILLQVITDAGAVSANWFIGAVLSALSIFMYRLLNRFEKKLEEHDAKLQEHEVQLQLHKQSIETNIKSMSETYVSTHRETLNAFLTKLGAMGAYQKS